MALLGDDRRLDDGRNDARRFRHALARDRLSGRLAAPVRLRDRVAAGLVPDDGDDLGRFDRLPARGGVLLGTALGDWIADSSLGYGGGAAFFGALLLALAGLYYATRISHVFLFWAAFILTRPLGATIGDYLDKPFGSGGLEVSRPLASLVLAVAIVLLVWLIPQRPGRHPGAGDLA